MDGATFGGAAVEAAFGQLLKLVIQVSKTTYLFKSRLDHIKMTLDSIKPEIDEIEVFSKLLKRKGTDSVKFVEKLEAGSKLILKCRKIKPWNVIGRYVYSRKLAAYENSLLWFMKVPVQACFASTSLKNLVGVEGLDNKLDILISKVSIFENINGGGYCDVSGLPDLIVGFDTNQQTSLDVFEENDIAKECFLDLGSFYEGQKIPAGVLLDMWIESYGQDDDDALEILYDLSLKNLINLSQSRKNSVEVDGFCNEYYVTQHDQSRELAICQSNQECIQHRKRLFLEIRDNSYPEWWIEQQQQPNCVRLLSISTDETFKSDWNNIELPSTEVLILNFNSNNYALPPFIKAMNKLKVMIITNYGSFPVELIDFQVLKYLYNLKRIRFEQVSIPSLATFLIQLKNLQKISFTMCEISKAFDGSSSETSNIFPNLTELEIDYCSDLVEFPIGLCNLMKLRKFSISYCSELIALPDEFGRLVNLEMLKIDSCTKLKELPQSICELHNLSYLDISGCTRMTRIPEQIGKLKNLKVLLMWGCVGIQDLPTSVKDLSELKNVICDEEISNLWKAYEHQITNLVISVVKQEDLLHNV